MSILQTSLQYADILIY